MKLTSLRIARVLLGGAALAMLAALTQTAQAETPLLLRNPSLSQDKIAFLYADDVWTVSRKGGEAERLTSNGHVSGGPFYSPDGAEIAYAAHLEGNTDVYVVPTEGGVPHRITWNPAGSTVVGWSRDGKSVLVVSMEQSYRHFLKLYLVHEDGSGMPEPLPLPSGFQGSFSPDGESIAYQPITKWEPAWKQYVGGQTTPIWLVNLKTLDLVKVPRENSNDSNPVWVGNTVYFLSDRDGPMSLFQYDVDSKAVTEVVHNTGFDLKTFQAGPGGLVYEQFGSIHFCRHRRPTAIQPVAITIHGELPNLAPHLAAVTPDEIRNARSFADRRARRVRGPWRDLYRAGGEGRHAQPDQYIGRGRAQSRVVARTAKSIAYFSDASGEYQLYLHDQTGFKPPTVIDLGPDPSYFYNPTWSPDSKHIAYTDKHLRLWLVDVPDGKTTAAPKPVLVDHGTTGASATISARSWSPDSKWIAYQRDLENGLNAIFLYSMDTHTFTQVTDGMSDATSPAFDANGKYLYFLASTDDGPSQCGHRSVIAGPLRRPDAPYVVVLAKDGASPIPPESDDEKIKDEKKDDDKKDADGR